MDFGELKNDTSFVTKITKLSECLAKIDEDITSCVEYSNYNNLPTEDKVKLDLFMSYSLNSLYWMYIKLQGIDPNTHGIKNELSRVRQSMLREKEVHERNTIRPVIDKGAASRFVKHGLKIKNKRVNENEKESEQPPINKKIKFVENLSDDDK